MIRKKDDSDDEKEEKAKLEKKTKVIEEDNFDMKSVMNKFIDQMMEYLLTPKSTSYLGLAPEIHHEDLDSDDELPPEFEKERFNIFENSKSTHFRQVF